MAIGHITLDGKEYMLKGGTLPSEPLANQMAPKVSSGGTGYDSSDNWSNLVVTDWQGGVGHTRPQEDIAGFLYAEAETRVPNQVILPAAVGGYAPQSSTKVCLFPAATNSNDLTAYTLITVGGGGYAKVASYFSASINDTVNFLDIYALIPTETQVTAQFYEGNSTLPNATLRTSGSATVGGYPYPRWYRIDLTPYTWAAYPKDFWFAVSPTSGSDSFQLVACNRATDTRAAATWDGSAWSTLADYPFFTCDGYHKTTFIGAVPYQGDQVLFVAQGTAVDLTFTYNGGAYSGGNLSGHPATSVLSYNNNYYVAFGGTGDDIENNLGTVAGEKADILGRHQGIAYKSIGNALYSSTDPGTAGTWTSLGTASDSPYEIRGMCGLGDTLYVACDDWLWGLFPGDFLVPVGPWGSVSPRNGRRMVAFQGAIYAIVNDRVWRIAPDGSMQDVWVSRDDDLVDSRLGRVVDLCTADTAVLALVNPDDSAACPTVWLLQGSEWHPLLTLPPDTVGTLYYDRISNNVFVGSSASQVYYATLPETAINPYNDPGVRFNYAGWLEYDWFYGAIVENDKDWESVAIMGDLSSSLTVQVYYKQDGDTAWSLLGTCDTDGEELYFAIPRTGGKRLKLGLLLKTANPLETPRIRAIRLKYMVMVKDWFRYNLSIDVSGGLNGAVYQEMLDGTYNPYTATQVKANLDALTTQTGPFTFVDIDGSQYLVKTYSALFQYTLVRYNPATQSKEWEGTYQLTLEAVRSGTYP